MQNTKNMQAVTEKQVLDTNNRIGLSLQTARPSLLATNLAIENVSTLEAPAIAAGAFFKSEDIFDALHQYADLENYVLVHGVQKMRKQHQAHQRHRSTPQAETEIYPHRFSA